MAITFGDETLFVGAVLSSFECSGYDDSDFYAVVWNEEKGRVERVQYDTTRHAGGGGMKVDATPEVIERAQEWLRTWYVESLTEDAKLAARRAEIGRIVRSTTKRGKNVGVEGEVRWIGPDRYSYKPTPRDRVGIQVEGEEKLRFLDITSVEVVTPEPVDAERIAERAEYLAQRRYWIDAVGCRH